VLNREIPLTKAAKDEGHKPYTIGRMLFDVHEATMVNQLKDPGDRKNLLEADLD